MSPRISLLRPKICKCHGTMQVAGNAYAYLSFLKSFNSGVSIWFKLWSYAPYKLIASHLEPIKFVKSTLFGQFLWPRIFPKLFNMANSSLYLAYLHFIYSINLWYSNFQRIRDYSYIIFILIFHLFRKFEILSSNLTILN